MCGGQQASAQAWLQSCSIQGGLCPTDLCRAGAMSHQTAPLLVPI